MFDLYKVTSFLVSIASISSIGFAAGDLNSRNLVPVDYYIKCSSLENPSKFIIEVSDPNLNEDCDIAYEDDCGRTIGKTKLITDLSNPSNMATASGNQKSHRGLFNEPYQPSEALIINVEGKYEAKLPHSFRQDLKRGNRKTKVTIESFQSDSGAFTLICKEHQFPTK